MTIETIKVLEGQEFDQETLQAELKAMVDEYTRVTDENKALQKLATDAYNAWNRDDDPRVGKLLIAMLSPEFRKTYRPDL